MKRVLAVRQDNNGDVLLAGPAIRALATRARVSLLCSRRGEAAARTLPGVRTIIVQQAEWIDPQPAMVDREQTLEFIESIRSAHFDEAVIFTSFHQSALPLALLLRIAGVRRIGAISVDYPGSLLDVRHGVDENIHEVERNLSLVRRMGYELPAGDDARLSMQGLPRHRVLPFRDYVVVHPGATAAARAWFPERNEQLVRTLCAKGVRVVVTGSSDEASLASYVAGENAVNLAGKTPFVRFAAIVRDAAAVICGNTAAAHVAAAVGTPVASIFPPTIPASRFRPWMVAHELLGDQQAPCAGCRARTCPVTGQPCLQNVHVEDVLAALRRLTPLAAEVA